MKNLWAYAATLSLVGTIFCMSDDTAPWWIYTLAGVLAGCTIRFTIMATYAEIDIRLSKIKASQR